MQEAGYVVCATCGDYAVDFNAVMLDCSTCENSYHHTCVGMGLGELGRRTAATNAMRKSKGKKNASADGDAVTGTLYDWKCPDCTQQQQPRQPEPEPEKEEVLVIEDTDEDEDDGERTTYIDLSYNVDLHRVAPSQRALLPTTTARRPAVHMQNVAGLLNRSNVGASMSSSRVSTSNIAASTSTSKAVPASASTSTSTSPQSHNAATTITATRNVQTPLSPPPSRSPSRTGPIAPVPFVDFTAMATSSKKRRRSPEAGEGGLEDERAKKKSRVAGPAALSRTTVEPIDLTLSDDEVLVTPGAPSTSSRRDAASMSSRRNPASVSSRRDAASVSSAGSRSHSRHGPGSVSSGTTDIATEDEPVPTRNLMRASLAGRTPRVPLPLAVGTAASTSTARPAPSPTASSRSTVPSKRRLSASPSNSHPASGKCPTVQNQEQDDDDDEEHAFFRSRRTSGVAGGGGLTRTRSDAAVLPDSTSTAAPHSTVPTRTQSDSALPLSASARDNRTIDDEPTALAVPASSTSTPRPFAPTSTSTRTPPSSSRPLGFSFAIEPRAVQAGADTPVSKKTSVAVHDVDVDDLPDYISDEEHERESTALPAASTAPSPSARSVALAPVVALSSSRAPPTTFSSARPTPTPTTTTTASSATATFRRPALPPPRAAALPPPRAPAAPSTAPIPSTAPVPSTAPAPAVPLPISTTRSRPQPLFLPDSPSPSPERRERESQRLMSLPPISFLDEEEVEDQPDREGARKEAVEDVDMDELEDEDEEELASGVGTGGGVGVIRKKKKKKRTDEEQLGLGASSAVEKVRPAPVPATDDAVVNQTERRKAKKHRVEQEDHNDDAGRSYAQQIVDERLEDVLEAGLASFRDRTRAGEGESTSSLVKKKKQHRDQGRDAVDTLARPALGLSLSVEKERGHTAARADAETSVGGGKGESSTSSSVKVKKKKKHRGDAVDPLARPAIGLSAPPEKHADTGEGESSTSGSVKEKKKKHRDRDRDAVDTLARPALSVSGSLEKTITRKDISTDATVNGGEGESSTSGSVNEKKKHRDRDRHRDAVDLLAVPSLGLSTSLEGKTKHRHLETDGGEGASSTSSSVKVKKKKHRDRDREALDLLAVPSLGLSTSMTLEKKTKRTVLDTGAGMHGEEGESSTSGSTKDKKKHRDGRSSTGVGEQVDLLARPMIGLPGSLRNTALGVDADAGESSTSSSTKKKKRRERVAAPEFKEPATPERRVDDLTVSWGRLQELASFSPSGATKEKTTAHVDIDVGGDAFSSTVREEASSSRQVGRKTARPPPLLDDSPSLASAVPSSSTRRPLAAMSASKQPLPPARFPAAGAVPASTESAARPHAISSSTVAASSSSSTARPAAAASRLDAEQRKEKEKQPMQMQRARKTVIRRGDRDASPAQVTARDPAPSSSAVRERTKADGHDAPGKGKSTLDKYSARAVASSSSSSTVLPPSTSTSTLPPPSRPSAAVRDPSSSRPSAPSSSRSKHRERPSVADPSVPFEAPVVPRRKAIAGVDYPLPDLPVSPAKAKADKKATARKAPRNALMSDEETPMDVDVDARVHTSRKGKEKEQAITVDDDFPPKEKARPGSRPKPPPIPRLRSASIWSSSTPTPAPSPYTTSSPSLDAVTAFLKKRRMANPLPSSSTLPAAPTQGQKMAATKRRLERGEHESDLPVPMSVLANAREMQTLRRLVKRSVVVEKPEYRVGEVKSDVVTAFDWVKYRAEAERKEQERDEQGVEDIAAT